MKNNLKTLSTKADDELIAKVDAEIARVGFKSQSEFIRYSIENTIKDDRNLIQIKKILNEDNKKLEVHMQNIFKLLQMNHDENKQIKHSVNSIAKVLNQLSNTDESEQNLSAK